MHEIESLRDRKDARQYHTSMRTDDPGATLTRLRLLRFFLPLAAIGLLQVGGPVVMNGVLLRSADGLEALAACTLAIGLLAPLQALLVFIPQLSMVHGRTAGARTSTFRFVFTGLALLSGCAWLVVAAPIGPAVLAAIYRLDSSMLADVRWYLLGLLPLVVLDGCGRWASGQLLLSGRSALTTGLEAAALVVQILILLGGLALGLGPVPVVVTSFIAASLIGQGGNLVMAFRSMRAHNARDLHPSQSIAFAKQLAFFAPLATTSICFAAGKSLLLAALTRQSEGGATMEVAVFGLLLSLNALFNQPVNQTRHLFTAFGDRNLPLVRTFVWQANAAIIGLAILMVSTPLAPHYLATIQGAQGDALAMAVSASPLLVLIAIAAACRSDVHGRAILARRTWIVGASALLRIAVIIIGSIAGVTGRWLDHSTALMVLTAGFIVEAIALTALYATTSTMEKEDVPHRADPQSCQ
jgi:hypothetical protein